MARKTLTPDEKDQIVLLRLERVPVRQVAERVGCTTNTVQKTWNAYLKQRYTERQDDLDIAFEDAIARLEKNAVDARHGYNIAKRDNNHPNATRYLNAERAALVELSKLGVVRDDEPAQAARILQAQLETIDKVLEGIDQGLIAAAIPVDQRKIIVGEVARVVRAIEN